MRPFVVEAGTPGFVARRIDTAKTKDSLRLVVIPSTESHSPMLLVARGSGTDAAQDKVFCLQPMERIKLKRARQMAQQASCPGAVIGWDEKAQKEIRIKIRSHIGL